MSTKKEIQHFVFPLIATNLLQLVIGQISLIVASRDSITYLSGMNTIQSLFFALGGILGVFNYAFNIQGAKEIGAENRKEYENFLASSLKLDVIIGTVFVLFVVVFGKLFLGLVYGFKGEMLTMSFLFFLTSSPYILLTLLMFTLGNVLKIEKKTAWILKVSIVTSLFQVFLNLLLVKLLGWGIFGAGLSSMLSLLALVASYAFLVRNTLRTLRFTEARYMSKLLKFGLPLVVQEIFEGVLFIIVFESLIARLGVETLAVYAITAQIFALTKMPTFMYAQGVTVFFTEALGKKEMAKSGEIFNFSLKGASGSYFLFSALFLLLAKPVATAFSADPSVVSKVPFFTFIVLASMIFSPLYEISKYALQSRGMGNIVLKWTAIVNSGILCVMLVLERTSCRGFTGLYCLNGGNILALSILFFLTNRKKMRTIR